MDDNEHEELMNYLESLEALEEADKELQETLGYILDITNQEIIMDINRIKMSDFWNNTILNTMKKGIQTKQTTKVKRSVNATS